MYSLGFLRRKYCKAQLCLWVKKYFRAINSFYCRGNSLFTLQKNVLAFFLQISFQKVLDCIEKHQQSFRNTQLVSLIFFMVSFSKLSKNRIFEYKSFNIPPLFVAVSFPFFFSQNIRKFIWTAHCIFFSVKEIKFFIWFLWNYYTTFDKKLRLFEKKLRNFFKFKLFSISFPRTSDIMLLPSFCSCSATESFFDFQLLY